MVPTVAEPKLCGAALLPPPLAFRSLGDPPSSFSVGPGPSPARHCLYLHSSPPLAFCSLGDPPSSFSAVSGL